MRNTQATCGSTMLAASPSDISIIPAFPQPNRWPGKTGRTRACGTEVSAVPTLYRSAVRYSEVCSRDVIPTDSSSLLVHRPAATRLPRVESS